jgi:hypothetical protein
MCCNRPAAHPIRSTPAKPRLSYAAAPPQPQRLQAGPRAAATLPFGLPAPVFEYVGATALTVVSPITRRTYRFAQRGVRVTIDPRDQSWIAFVPNLVAAS